MAAGTHHSEFSSFREKALEHIFVGECLRALWRRGVYDVEVLRADVDGAGYDIVIEAANILRHIQLKASYSGARTAGQNVHVKLADKPSGCVVWIRFDPETLDLGPFLWFGGLPGEKLPSLDDFPLAKHTKGNAQGLKSERPNIRRIAKSRFETVTSLETLLDNLFGLSGMNQP